ncbi:hypothetical protein E3N88_31920 [Mikania micrantha]|uniref:Uncharacterized protein n=1 Tax=Mikania micrantha TaxID=192012 RepID=A0A5N6M874_9ASTR|nr:hypothetical protein E3N88_31920 [Mikania micrantha]
MVIYGCSSAGKETEASRRNKISSCMKSDEVDQIVAPPHPSRTATRCQKGLRSPPVREISSRNLVKTYFLFGLESIYAGSSQFCNFMLAGEDIRGWTIKDDLGGDQELENEIGVDFDHREALDE